MLGPHRVAEGDALVGLASSGLHSNGFSLVRRALLEEAGYALDDDLLRLGRPLGDELLEPTTVYAPAVLALAREGLVLAAAHVTGGGLVGNVPRSLPDALGAEIREGSWPVPPIFDLVREASGASRDEMSGTFNMGVGMTLVVPSGRVAEALAAARERGVAAFDIGRVVDAPGVRFA
jgi:phosphoribosylformylglycinamidine cyclo-ligase